MKEFSPALVNAIIGSILFLIWNKDRKLLLPIVALLFLTLSMDYFLIFYDNTVIWILLVSSDVSLLVLYFLRLKNKPQIGLIEYLKLFAIVLICLHPFILMYGYIFGFSLNTIRMIDFTIIPIVGIIYLYDRLILNTKSMKKTFVIALCSQTLLIFLFLLYAYQQKLQADQNLIVAEEQRIMFSKELQKSMELKQENDSLISELRKLNNFGK